MSLTEYHISLDVHWQHLQSLNSLSITGVLASFGQNSLGLLQLKLLQDVTLELRPYVKKDMAYFADMLYQFGIFRPDVCLRVDDQRVGAKWIPPDPNTQTYSDQPV